jgi:ADP-ribose pyrophosphatase
MPLWKTLEKHVRLDMGKFLTVEEHAVQFPDGRIIKDWPWIITPDYINVVAITDDDQFLMFRQGKYGIEGLALAPVGGYLEPGEEPLAAAQRELFEETGYQAREWTALGDYRVDANRGCGTAHFFVARGAHRAGERHADDLEEQTLLMLTRDQVAAALARGEFRVLGWAANVALALLHDRAVERDI